MLRLCHALMRRSQCLLARLLARVPPLIKEAWSRGLKRETGDFQYWPKVTSSALAVVMQASKNVSKGATVKSVHFG